MCVCAGDNLDFLMNYHEYKQTKICKPFQIDQCRGNCRQVHRCGICLQKHPSHECKISAAVQVWKEHHEETGGAQETTTTESTTSTKSTAAQAHTELNGAGEGTTEVAPRGSTGTGTGAVTSRATPGGPTTSGPVTPLVNTQLERCLVRKTPQADWRPGTVSRTTKRQKIITIDGGEHLAVPDEHYGTLLRTYCATVLADQKQHKQERVRAQRAELYETTEDLLVETIRKHTRWIERWETCMSLKSVTTEERYKPGRSNMRHFGSWWIGQAGATKQIKDMRAALNWRAASLLEEDPYYSDGSPWDTSAVNTEVSKYESVYANAAAREKEEEDETNDSDLAENTAEAIPEAVLHDIVERGQQALVAHNAVLAGRLAGAFYLPVLSGARGSTIGASSPADIHDTEGGGLRLRIRKVKKWSQEGTFCKNALGGSIDLRKEPGYFLLVPAPPSPTPTVSGQQARHPRQIMIDCIRYARDKGTLDWLMIGGARQQDADVGFREGAKRISDAIELQLQLKEARHDGHKITSHCGRKTFAALLHRAGAPWETIARLGLWTNAKTPEKFYAPGAEYVASPWSLAIVEGLWEK